MSETRRGAMGEMQMTAARSDFKEDKGEDKWQDGKVHHCITAGIVETKQKRNSMTWIMKKRNAGLMRLLPRETLFRFS